MPSYSSALMSVVGQKQSYSWLHSVCKSEGYFLNFVVTGRISYVVYAC